MPQNLVTTSFQIDCDELNALQKHAERKGFKSWGSFLRYVLNLHVVTFERDMIHNKTKPTT
jgi:hypothetical protein